MKWFLSLAVILALVAAIMAMRRRPAVVPTRTGDEARLTQSVRFFRDLGFFADRSSLPPEQLAANLGAALEAQWGSVPAASDPLFDLLLTRLDPARVWWEDMEADVCNGNLVYVRMLRELGAISRGAFTPSDIEETWAGEDGPVSVTFTHGGERCRLQPAVQDDWIDFDVLRHINRLLGSSAMRFCVCEPFDQTAFVVALTTDERARLERERGWKFMRF